MTNDINAVISQIMALKKQGRSPQSVMQILMQRNPQYSQALQQLKNMSGGRNPKEFVMQLAMQNGISQENLQAIQELFRQ